MKTQPRLRDRKKARTHEAILQAATRLYLAHGYDATTVDQIANEASVARRTFFRYFPRKDDTVFPHQEERLALFCERLQSYRADLEPFAAVVRACLDLAVVFDEHRDDLAAQYAIVRASPALIARQTEFDVQWEGALLVTLLPSAAPSEAERRHAQVFAGAVMGMVRAALDDWLLAPADADLVERGREALGWIEAGYAASRSTLTAAPPERP